MPTPRFGWWPPVAFPRRACGSRAACTRPSPACGPIGSSRCHRCGLGPTISGPWSTRCCTGLGGRGSSSTPPHGERSPFMVGPTTSASSARSSMVRWCGRWAIASSFGTWPSTRWLHRRSRSWPSVISPACGARSTHGTCGGCWIRPTTTSARPHAARAARARCCASACVATACIVDRGSPSPRSRQATSHSPMRSIAVVTRGQWRRRNASSSGASLPIAATASSAASPSKST